jgi:prepilin-type N-terminal cleavage/methylation domain-containing protein
METVDSWPPTLPIDACPDGPYNLGVCLRAPASGFTLTEVLIAMGILAIGAVAALSLFAAGAATQKRAIDRANSAYLAEQVVALLDARLAGDVDLQDLVVEGASLPSCPGYTYDVSLTDLDDESGWSLEVLVEVTVRWKRKGKGREATYQTILLRSLGEKDYLGGE